MPEEQEKFQKAVDTAVDAVMFENWLRFYFIAESEEKDENGEAKLIIAIPEQGMAKIKELYPTLLTLAEDINGREASFETSQTAVCTYIVRTVDGKLVQQGTSASLVDTRAFQIPAQLFNIWVQAYEKQLDRQFYDFASWKKMFGQWRTSDMGREIEEKLKLSAPSSQPSMQ